MGDDVTKKSIEMHLSQSIRPLGRLQNAARVAGVDPKDVNLKVNHKNVDGQKPDFILSFVLPHFTCTHYAQN